LQIISEVRKMPKVARKISTLDSVALRASRPHHPQPAAGRGFAVPRLPQDFRTVIDPGKHPLQPWRDLPPPTGLPPFHMSLDSILSADAIALITNSGKMVFHSVGDTGGVNTPTQVDNVATYMESDFSGNGVTNTPIVLLSSGRRALLLRRAGELLS
jgi:hypothetical protein